MGYPDPESEREILRTNGAREQSLEVASTLTAEDIRELQEAAENADA